MKTNVLRLLFILSPGLLLSINGCSTTTIKNISEYDPKPMLQSEVTPTAADLENRPFRVIVFEISDKDVDLGQSSDVGTSVAGTLVSHINKSNAVIVDRKGLTDLKNAIENNTTDYKNNSTADYAITGHINVANYTKTYYKATAYKDKEGKLKVIEAHCSHNALVQGNIHIHALKDMQHAHTINISGGANRDIKVTHRSQSRCNDLSRTEILSLVRSAGIKAANREDVTFQNFFQPKGYVLERRTNGKTDIFKITLGKNNGAIKGQKAEFFTLTKSQNPITQKIATDENRIGEGAVTNQIFAKHAWVIIDNPEIAAQIKLGDIVKLTFEKSFFGKIFNSSFHN